MKTMTPRQREIYDWIVEYMKREKMPPTLQEIVEAMGMHSKNGPAVQLRAIEKKGWIRRMAGPGPYRKSRGIRLAGEECPHCNGLGVILKGEGTA